MFAASANFLNRARLDSGKFSLDLNDLNLHERLGSVASLFQMAINTNKIGFKLSLAPDAIFIHADRAPCNSRPAGSTYKHEDLDAPGHLSRVTRLG